jgi:hypothetical protein
MSFNPLSALSSAVKELTDAALPADLQFIGDGVEASVDVLTGNLTNLPHDMMDFAQDFAQNTLAELGKLTGQNATTTAPPATSTPPSAAAAPAATPSSSSSPTASTSPSTSSTPAATSSPTSSPATAAPGTSTPTTAASNDAFFSQSDTDLMNAVRDGKIPDSVKNDPAQMERLQLRMNEISEMNQLISQMTAAMHDMNKAVIQNIRA